MVFFTKYAELFRGLITVKDCTSFNRKKRDGEVQKSEMIVFVRGDQEGNCSQALRGGEKYITME